MGFSSVKLQDNTYVANTYGRFDLCLVKGKNATATDINGKSYIDFGSGIGVNSLGYCNDAWAQAVCAQVQTLNHTSNLYYTLPGTQLAEKLCKKTGYEKVFFGNSGAEANEGMIKAARKYSSDKYSHRRSEIIVLQNSFHGRTITTLAATGQEVFHKNFTPLTAGFCYAVAGNLADVESKITPNTCAVMVEMIQGEGGVVALDKNFVQQLAALCAKNDILLLDDEVQTGMGRTGTLLACEQLGVKPNIVSLAKGLGGGLPIGAVLFDEKTKNTLGISDHGSTFGANPIVCAGAMVVADTLTDTFLAEVTAKSKHIFAAVGKMPHVKSVSGLGLMIGVEFEDVAGRDVVQKCMEKGVLFLTAKHKLRMLPPLTITLAEIEKGLAVLQEVLTEI
ncbi:MAG: aspartate aminotransferase family protein [Oscillospiraceae bacterium]|nr:aspartate aminotransferase family protein [Oscillospiraceae bacterium]